MLRRQHPSTVTPSDRLWGVNAGCRARSTKGASGCLYPGACHQSERLLPPNMFGVQPDSHAEQLALHVTATANLRRSPRFGVPDQVPGVTLMRFSAAAACGSPTETVRMPSR